MAYEDSSGSVYSNGWDTLDGPFHTFKNNSIFHELCPSRSAYDYPVYEYDLNFDHIADTGNDEAGTVSRYTLVNLDPPNWGVVTVSLPYLDRIESSKHRTKTVIYVFDGSSFHSWCNGKPALKIVYRYYDDARTVLKSIRRYDYAFEKRRTPGDFDGFEYPRTPRLRTEICYAPDGSTVKAKRCFFYNDPSDWHKRTGIDRRVPCAIKSKNIVLGSGTYEASIIHGFYPGFGIWYDAIVVKSGVAGEVLFVAERINTHKQATIGSDLTNIFERTSKRIQGDWNVDDGQPYHDEDSPSQVHRVLSSDNKGRVFARVDHEENEDGILILTDERKLNARSGAVAVKTVKVGAATWATEQELESGTTQSVTTYTRAPDGKMLTKITIDKTGETDATTQTTTYTYGTHAINKKDVLLNAIIPDGDTPNRYYKDYIEDKFHNIIEIHSHAIVPAASVVNDGIAKDSDASDPLSYIASRILALTKLYGAAKAFLSPVYKAVKKISDDRDSVTPEEVKSLLDNVRNHIARSSGFMGADLSAELNFWLTSIQAFFGCLDKAEDQLAYIDRCLEVVSRHGLANDLLENCDVAVWGLGGLTAATWCATGYTFDPDLVAAAVSITSDCLAALKTNEIELKDAADAIKDSVARARPTPLPDADKIAVRMINLALARSGTTRQINSLDEETTEGIVSRVLFEQCRRKILMAQAWSWAVTDVQLKTKPNTILNPERWPFMARLPAECLTTSEIWSGHRNERFDHLIPFEVNGRRIFCEMENPWMRYVKDAPLTSWPELALDALAWELAAELTMPLTVKPELAASLFKMAELAIERAFAHDRNQQVKDPDPPSRFITARC